MTKYFNRLSEIFIFFHIKASKQGPKSHQTRKPAPPQESSMSQGPSFPVISSVVSLAELTQEGSVFVLIYLHPLKGC